MAEEEEEIQELSEEEAREYRHEELMKAIQKMTLAITNSKGDAEIKDLISNNVVVLGSVAAQMQALSKSRQDVNVEVHQDKVVKAISDMSDCLTKCMNNMTACLNTPAVKTKREFEFIIDRDVNGKFSKIIAKEK